MTLKGQTGSFGAMANLFAIPSSSPGSRTSATSRAYPKGRYELKKRFVQKLGAHLLVVDVPNRSWILIHPANDAKAQLKGCIAPVTNLIGPGKGKQSRLANEKLKALLLQALERKEKAFMTIKSKQT
jgi:hypothetical protein